MKNNKSLTAHILRLVQKHDGIKSKEVARITDRHINTVSSMLTLLKLRGKITNKNALWYGTFTIREEIKNKLLELHDDSMGAWAEGYISGLADYEIISEVEFDMLLNFIKTQNDVVDGGVGLVRLCRWEEFFKCLIRK